MSKHFYGLKLRSSSAFAALLVLSGAAWAQNTPSGDVPVVDVPAASSPAPTTIPTAAWSGPIPAPQLAPGARISAAVMDDWLSHPDSLLTNYPTGGPAMANYVALLAGSDNRAVGALTALARSEATNPMQTKAIAEGLAAAAKDAQLNGSSYGAYILAVVADANIDSLNREFNVALTKGPNPNIATSSLGSAGGGGGGQSSGSLAGGGDVGNTGLGDDELVAQTSGSFPVDRATLNYVGDGNTDDSSDEVSSTLVTN